MKNMFHPEDEVMREDETDPRNYGQVSYVWLKDMKPGQIVVRFKEDNEAIDPDTLILREEWMRLHGYTSYNQLHGYGPYTKEKQVVLAQVIGLEPKSQPPRNGRLHSALGGLRP